MREARSELVAFLDHDDIWLPRKLEAQLARLAVDPAADGVFVWLENFVSEEIMSEERDRIRCPTEPSRAPSATGALLWKSVFDRLGPWPASLREGVEWFHLARESGIRLLEVTEVLARRRLHLTNRTRLGAGNNRDYLRIAREAVIRKRHAAAGAPIPKRPPYL